MDAQEILDFEEMFATNGWRRMERDAEEAIRMRESVALRAKTIEDIRFMEGEASQLAVIVNLREGVALHKQMERNAPETD